MNFREFITALLASLAAAGAIAGAVEAGMKAGPNMAGSGHHRLKVPSGAPPLDGLPTPTGAYSFRKLRTAYAGSAMRLQRLSDNAPLDIGFLGFVPGLGAPWDEAAAAAHCAATTCLVITWYDQGGGTTKNISATAPNVPTLVFNCDGNLPCMRTTLNTQGLASTMTPATGVVSISVVGHRPAGGSPALFRQNGAAGNRVAPGAANQWTLAGGSSGTILATAADSSWHAAQGIINGASSRLVIDGAATTGTVTGSTTAASYGINGANATTSYGEAIIWDNYALTPTEDAVLTANQRGFWGTP